MSHRTTARRTRTPLPAMDKVIHEFLFNHGEAKTHADARDKAKEAIKTWFANGDPRFYRDANGSLFFDFEKPLEIGGRKYDGLEDRRRAVQVLDEDALDDLLDSLEPAQRDSVVSYQVTITVSTDHLEQLRKQLAMRGIDDINVDTVVDEAALLALQQQKVITEEQLDGLYRTEIQWALYPKSAL